MRHAHEKQSIHPTALMVGAELGMDAVSMKEVIAMVAEENPALVIGGFNIDVTIIGIVAVMRLEDHFQRENFRGWADTDRDEILNRTNECLSILYAGVV